MATNTTEPPIAIKNERVIREYFESRPGWTVTKLDKGKKRAADFRICNNSGCFLCEVKTINSVHANFPYTPLDYFVEQRTKRRDEIKKWMEENPDRQLIMPGDEWKFIHGDEAEFAAKYQGRKRNTERSFKGFAETMRTHLASSSICELPYSFRLDSDDLYAPNPIEQRTFFEWLENEVRAIDKGKPSWHWQVTKLQYGRAALYSAVYEIHKPSHENDVKAKYHLSLEGPREQGNLEVNIFSYGGLNLERITSNVEDALGQLESSALREKDQQIPRIIVLAFESGIGFEWQELTPHIAWLLSSHPKLSAIAVLDWVFDAVHPSSENGFLAWASFGMKLQVVPRFVVCHNSRIRDVKPLATDAFSDKWSTQFSPAR